MVDIPVLDYPLVPDPATTQGCYRKVGHFGTLMPISLPALVQYIPTGASLALAPDYSGCAMAAIRELMRRKIRGLRLIGIPQMGFQADLLIGAGCVASVETAAVTLGEFGRAPCFTRAIQSGAIEILDATCPAIHAGLQAAEKGLPFMPLRGILGSDLLVHRGDWKVIDNPFANHDPIVLLPAIHPQACLFHAPLADREGNVWVGVRRELMLAAHASRGTLVTVEKISDENFLDDERLAAGTIPALYISAIAEVSQGAWPLGLGGCYDADTAHLREYAALAATEAGFDRYVQKHVYGAQTP